MSRSLARPWRIFLSVAVLALILTACQPGRLSLRNLTEALTTPTPIEEAPTLEATATPTAIHATCARLALRSVRRCNPGMRSATAT